MSDDIKTIEELTRGQSKRKLKCIRKLADIAHNGGTVVYMSVPRDDVLAFYNLLLNRLINGYYDDVPKELLDASYVHKNIRSALVTLKAGGRVSLDGRSLLTADTAKRGRSRRAPGTWFVPDGVTIIATPPKSELKATDYNTVDGVDDVEA